MPDTISAFRGKLYLCPSRRRARRRAYRINLRRWWFDVAFSLRPRYR
jgi:hypothetical protein